MSNKIFITIFVTFLFFLSGCTGFLELEMKGSTELKQLISTEQGMLTAVNGIYQPLQPLYKGPMQRITDLASDDGWTWRNELEPDLFIVEQGFTFTATIWQQHYLGIGRANVVLDYIDDVTDYTSDKSKSYFSGQAKFMRAFYYFNLVRLFGGVPVLEHQVNTLDEAQVKRSSIAEVYALIENDLADAEQLLPDKYIGVGSEAGRPTTYSASALKVLVHLEKEEWEKVIEAADKVIEKGVLIDYAKNFNGTAENGSQSFFEIQYGGVTGSTTTSLSTFYAPSATPSGSALILPTDDRLNGTGGGPSSGGGFVQVFDGRPEDKRKNVILNTYGLPNQIDASQPDGSLYYVNKYYNTVDPVGQSTWNFPLVRYAEILLAKAEALNERAYIPNGEAFTLLNQLRENAGLVPLSSEEAPTRESFRNYIRAERRIELSFECKRYFDLNRWGIMQNVIQPQLDYLNLKFPDNKMIQHPVTGKDYFLYPLPATEFINNARLGEQNPGYIK
jgi:hypothetical protein